MVSEPKRDTTNQRLSKPDMEVSLGKVLGSNTFANSPRMQGFLSYVVTEAIDGRSDEIRAKTIAQDVYRRNAAEDGDPENVVRVDARRLRRRLNDYYDNEGRNDVLRIHIDSGGYSPRFEVQSTPTGHSPDRPVEKSPNLQPTLQTNVVIAGFIVVGILVLSLVLVFSGQFEFEAAKTSSQPTSEGLKRQALLERSPATLQAANMSEQARNMIFPLFDVKQQKLSLSIFEESINIDPTYFGGYAGAAFSLGTLSILERNTDAKRASLEKAQSMIAKAIQLDPINAWTQASAAWVAFVENQSERATMLSERAVGLDPADGYVLDIHTLILLFTGDFAEARSISDPRIRKHTKTERSGYRNIYAAACYFLGDFRQTLAALEQAAESGNPISPPRLAFQSAALHALGEIDQARATANLLMKTWPNFPLEEILLAFFKNKDHAISVTDRLSQAGWGGR